MLAEGDPMLRSVKTRLQRYPRFQWFERTVRSSIRHYQENEIALLPFLVDPQKVAIDVGAHAGVYTHVLLDLGASVVSIEANPKVAEGLIFLYGQKAQIVCAAASSSAGSVKLRIPKALPSGSHGIATVEATNTLDGAEVDEVEVPQITLDGMNLGSVGFIKVDVEGHEYDVLLGAKGILERDHPAILAEAEERHKPSAVQSICDLLGSLGYHGFMLDDGRLSPIANFDPARDQFIPANQLNTLNSGGYKGRYINNFLFVA
jgi:FkbM family methyltransferase